MTTSDELSSVIGRSSLAGLRAKAEAAERQMLAEMRSGYFEAFGHYPSPERVKTWLRDNPGAVDLWVGEE